MDKIGIINYGCGNLASLSAALKRLKVNFQVSGKVTELEDCSKFILPGVGAFPYAMQKLSNLKLDKFLREKAENNFPILGVCLGMQLLFEESEEFGNCEGIGLLKGRVRRLPSDFPICPNIGWWSLDIQDNFSNFGLTRNDTFYFVHSFYCTPLQPETQINLAMENFKICALITKGSITAVQFHPEKSQKSGEKILRNFLK